VVNETAELDYVTHQCFERWDRKNWLPGPSNEARFMKDEAPVRETSAGPQAINAVDGKRRGESFSARTTLRPANFYCRAPRANSVQVAGDFNHWNPFPMQRRDDGWWFIQIMLPHGHHQYRFLVDDKPVLDPRAMGKGRNQLNEEVSVVAVG
jgi:Glycogen recognition site of AMP-activated protein kinase